MDMLLQRDKVRPLKSWRAAIMFLLAITASAATAQTPADRADARCILVLALAGQTMSQKDAATRGQFYYYGRIAARGTSAKLGPLLLAEAKTLTTARQVQNELALCSGDLTAANANLGSGLLELQNSAQKAPKPGTAPPK